MKIFAEGELREYLEQNTRRLQVHIENQTGHQFLAVDEKTYAEDLFDTFRVEALSIRFDDMHVSSSERMIPAEHFPFEFNVYRGKSYRKPIVRFHIPFDGNSQLLRFTPSTRILWTTDVVIEGNEIVLEVINWRDDAQEIKRASDDVVRSIRTQYQHLTQEVLQYNSGLTDVVLQAVRGRREALQKTDSLLAALQLPTKPSTPSFPRAAARPRSASPKPVKRDPSPIDKPEMQPHVFVSYVRDDSTQVSHLVEALQSRGVEVWLDRKRIMPGQRWKDAIRDAIRKGASFIACFSAAYTERTRTYMNEELTLAIEELRQRPTDRAWFIPVILQGGKVPERAIGGGESLRDLQWVELSTENWDSEIDRIAEVLRGVD